MLEKVWTFSLTLLQVGKTHLNISRDPCSFPVTFAFNFVRIGPSSGTEFRAIHLACAASKVDAMTDNTNRTREGLRDLRRACACQCV